MALQMCSQGRGLLLQQHFGGVGAFAYTRPPQRVDAVDPAWRKWTVQGQDRISRGADNVDEKLEAPEVPASSCGNEHHERFVHEVEGASSKQRSVSLAQTVQKQGIEDEDMGRSRGSGRHAERLPAQPDHAAREKRATKRGCATLASNSA